MSEKRPEFTATIKAMVKYPTAHVEEDAELAEALQMTEDLHVAMEANADRNGCYGCCRGCGEWWPCPAWRQVSYAAVGWLVDASNAIMRRSGSLGLALPVGVKLPPLDVALPECFACRGSCRGYQDVP